MTTPVMFSIKCPASTASPIGAVAVIAIISLFITFWYNHRTAQISLRTNMITLFPEFLGKIDIEKLTRHDRGAVENFYSIMVTFIQLVDTSGLKGIYKESTKEAFWLLCSPEIWDEIHSGSAAKDVCSSSNGTEVLKSHRETLVDSFEEIILKHKKSRPSNRFLTIKND